MIMVFKSKTVKVAKLNTRLSWFEEAMDNKKISLNCFPMNSRMKQLLI